MLTLSRRLSAALLLVIAAGAVPAAGADDPPGALNLYLLPPDSASSDLPQKTKLYAQSYALVVGINKYAAGRTPEKAGWAQLKNAVPDAEKVAVALRMHGFDVPPPLLNPTGAQLAQAAKEFFIRKGRDPESRLLFWFAGHGATLPVPHRKGKTEGYLVASDTPFVADEEDFRESALALRQLLQYMDQAKAKHVLAIFDSCFSGNILQDIYRGPQAVRERISSEVKNPIRLLITSGTDKQEVKDDGTFRELFVKALAGDHEVSPYLVGPYLRGTDLARYLEASLTRITSANQTPRWDYLRNPEVATGDFIFEVNKSHVRGLIERLASRSKEAAVVGVAPPEPAQPAPRPASPLDELIDKCVPNTQHPGAVAISRRLVAYVKDKFRTGRKFENKPLFADNREKEKWSTVRLPKDIKDADSSGRQMRLYFSASNAEVALIPVLSKGAGAFTETGVMLQGVWMNDRGRGCLEVQFDESAEAGQVKWWTSHTSNFLLRAMQGRPFLSELKVVAAPAP